jgi:hypothetical protein
MARLCGFCIHRQVGVSFCKAKYLQGTSFNCLPGAPQRIDNVIQFSPELLNINTSNRDRWNQLIKETK